MNASIKDSAQVAPTATIGAGTTVWELAQVREEATLGESCVVGRGAYVGTGVQIGDRCKLQNYALVYEPARLGDGVFIGPAAVLTNDEYPRSVAPDGTLKGAQDWQAVGVDIEDGASIMVGGFGSPGTPFALLDTLLEQGQKHLTLIKNDANESGIGIGKLISAGRVDRL
ncbi:MAG: hypothetical protein L0H31_14240, partial [Nocardioidaceae bacterium]|nr:hypothetical protein [Nocardioidaceae bacterium]